MYGSGRGEDGTVDREPAAASPEGAETMSARSIADKVAGRAWVSAAHEGDALLAGPPGQRGSRRRQSPSGGTDPSPTPDGRSRDMTAMSRSRARSASGTGRNASHLELYVNWTHPLHQARPGGTTTNSSSSSSSSWLPYACMRYRINALLPLLPAGWVAAALHASDTLVFASNFLGVLPLGVLLGKFTEDIAWYSTPTLGALLNATFGNVVELILSVAALRQNMPEVLKATMLGSMISNQLLVTGVSFLAGGVRYAEQQFSSGLSDTNMSIMYVTLMGLLFPTVFAHAAASGDGDGDGDGDAASPAALIVSRCCAVVLLLVYGSYLVFELWTHAHHFAGNNGEEDSAVEDGVETGRPNAAAPSSDATTDDRPDMSLWACVSLLALTTVLISVASERLIGSLSGVARAWRLTPTFISFILLPLVGNAAEHLSAVTMALRNKMDIAVSVAIGSAVQIGLFVFPTLVTLAWLMGVPLSLQVSTVSAFALTASTVVVANTLRDHASNWLEGVELLAVYLVVGVCFLYAE